MSFFLVPIIGSGTAKDPFRPKYIEALNVAWAMVDHGSAAIVWADTTAAQNSTIGANSDATVVPPLDNTIALTATQNALEALNIPAQWLTASMTYRGVLRIVVGIAQLLQRLHGLGTPVVLSQSVLNVTFGSLSAQNQSNITTAIASLGLDGSAIVSTTTVRQILHDIGQQFYAGHGVALGDL